MELPTNLMVALAEQWFNFVPRARREANTILTVVRQGDTGATIRVRNIITQAQCNTVLRAVEGICIILGNGHPSLDSNKDAEAHELERAARESRGIPPTIAGVEHKRGGAIKEWSQTGRQELQQGSRTRHGTLRGRNEHNDGNVVKPNS